LEVNLAAMVGEYQYPKVLMILLSDFIKKAWPHCNVNVLKNENGALVNSFKPYLDKPSICLSS